MVALHSIETLAKTIPNFYVGILRLRGMKCSLEMIRLWNMALVNKINICFIRHWKVIPWKEKIWHLCKPGLSLDTGSTMNLDSAAFGIRRNTFLLFMSFSLWLAPLAIWTQMKPQTSLWKPFSHWFVCPLLIIPKKSLRQISTLRTDMVAHAFNPILIRQWQVNLWEFETNMICIVSSKPASATPASEILPKENCFYFKMNAKYFLQTKKNQAVAAICFNEKYRKVLKMDISCTPL